MLNVNSQKEGVKWSHKTKLQLLLEEETNIISAPQGKQKCI